jgi:GTP-binding protein HflX
VIALNKADLVDQVEAERLARRHPGAVLVSALTGSGIEELIEALAVALPAPPIEVHLVVPYDRTEVVARLYRDGQVLETEEMDDGLRVDAMIAAADLPAVEPFLRRPVRRSSSV